MIANALADRRASLPQPAAGERRCRRCDADLTGGTDARSSFDYPSLSVFRCPRCDYLNVTGDSAHPLLLRDALALVGSDDLAGELIDQLRDSGDGAAVLRRVLQAMVERLIEWIDREPQAAAARIWWDLEHAEDILRGSKASDVSRSAYTKGAALLYGLISRHGPPEIASGIDLSNISIEIRQHVLSVATDAALLGARLLMFLRGEFTARVEGEQISWEPTEYYLNFAEWRLNRHQEYGQRPPRTDEALDAVFEQALQLARGYTMESFVALVGEITRQVRQTLPPGEPLRLLWPQRAALTEQERRMLDDWSLTPERLRRFSEPFYFDLGQPARQPQTDVELGISILHVAVLLNHPSVYVLKRSCSVWYQGAKMDLNISDKEIPITDIPGIKTTPEILLIQQTQPLYLLYDTQGAAQIHQPTFTNLATAKSVDLAIRCTVVHDQGEDSIGRMKPYTVSVRTQPPS